MTKQIQESRTAFILLQIILTVVLLEVSSRVLFPAPEITNFNRIDFTHTAYFGGLRTISSKPIHNVGLTWQSEPDRYAFTAKLNEYGFRTPSFKIAKDSFRTRIVCIGDSFVEGFGADDEHTYPAQLQKILSKRGKYEVINLGVGGNSFPDYLHELDVVAPLLKPDVVVVTLFENDLPTPPFADPPPRAAPIYYNPFSLRSFDVIYNLANGKSPTTRFNQGTYPFFLPVPDPANPLTNNPPPTSADPEIVSAMRRGTFNPFVLNGARAIEGSLQREPSGSGSLDSFVSKMKEICTEEKCSLYFNYIPLHVTVSDFYYPLWNHLGDPFLSPTLTGEEFRGQQRYLTKLMIRERLPFKDLTPIVEKIEATGTQLFHGYDEHMNADGYRVVAEEVGNLIQPED